LVGYGGSANGDGANFVDANPAVKRVGSNALDSLRAGHTGGGNQYFVFDFDGGGAPNALGGGTLGNTVEANYAGGDSGGPVLQFRSGRWQLVGVNTFLTSFPGGPSGGGVFGTGGGGVLLAPYSQWIAQVIADTSSPGLAPTTLDIPVPGWALAALAFGLSAAWRARSS
jgi:hypothetical protein